MKTTKRNQAEERLAYLDRVSLNNEKRGDIIDLDNAEIGIKVVDNKATIYAYGKKFEGAKYTAVKIDCNDVATEVSFRDFTFAAKRINELDFNAVLSVDGINKKISAKNPYDYDMRILLVVYTPGLVVKITLYNAFKFAPGLSGCHVSIGVEGINCRNVREELAATLAVMKHDTSALLDQSTVNSALMIPKD